MGIFSKINFGLTKTRNKMAGAIDDLFGDAEEITEDLYAQLEEILVMGDVGVVTAVEITDRLKKRVAEKHLRGAQAVKNEIKEIVAELLDGGEDMGLVTVPSVVLVIGVNGVGKTTTIGKLAARYKAEGKKVILGAADTFRAAAIDQLDIWAQRAGVDIVQHSEGADPAPDPAKRHNAAILLGGDPGEPPPAPFLPLPYPQFLDQLRRFLPAYLRAADPHWLQCLADWMTALERATGASAMKDLTDALRFYDRNREKIESLLAFRRELAEESDAFAKRLEAKLRAAGLGDGLAVEPGGRLVLARAVRLENHPYEALWTAEVRLEELALRTTLTLRRDLATRRRPPADEAARLIEGSPLAALAGERRINPENPEALAYQALRSLLQAAHETFARLA